MITHHWLTKQSKNNACRRIKHGRSWRGDYVGLMLSFCKPKTTFGGNYSVTAIGVKLDFSKTYQATYISEDLRILMFNTALRSGASVPLRVQISNMAHELMPDVFNIAFGPMDARGNIDDKAELTHSDYSAVFSTILLTSLNYLTANKHHYLGIDGSDNRRAHYYWRFLQRDFVYLNSYFKIYGLKYYVRITRFGKRQYDNPFDFNDIHPEADRLVKTSDAPEQMYNYFIFTLK